MQKYFPNLHQLRIYLCLIKSELPFYQQEGSFTFIVCYLDSHVCLFFNFSAQNFTQVSLMWSHLPLLIYNLAKRVLIFLPSAASYNSFSMPLRKTPAHYTWLIPLQNLLLQPSLHLFLWPKGREGNPCDSLEFSAGSLLKLRVYFRKPSYKLYTYLELV